MFTGADNETQDLGRWLSALSFASGIFYEGWDVIINAAAFSMQDFGVGMGALAAGAGAMLKLKENTEPKVKDTP
jgi:hypothetical protein